MFKRLITVVLFSALAAIQAAGQAQPNRFPPINLVAGDPTGTACPANAIVQSSTSGILYTCQGGAYHLPGGASLPPAMVAWPPSCATGTYVPATNTCVATGTAANPGGGAPQLQFNAGGTFSGDPLVVLDITGNSVTPVHTLMGNVNGEINPYNYGARGDNGVTDNTTAINAACTAAKLYSPPAVVTFPKATGYYLTGALDACAGISLRGQSTMSLALPSGGVVLRGKPGQDVIHYHDPNTATGAGPARSWDISNLNIAVDDSVNATASFPHRWPGRWTQDGTIAIAARTVSDGVTNGSITVTSATMAFVAGDVGKTLQITYTDTTTNSIVISAFVSATSVVLASIPTESQSGATFSIANASTLTSSKQLWTCSDVGVGVVVKGAGAAGADLVTSIASLPSCNSVQSTAFLAAPASTAVTNALTYTSVRGVAATQTIGNCGIAGDNFDGNAAHYASGWTGGLNGVILRNVVINSVSGTAQNGTCGIYLQGIWQSYQTHVDFTNIFRLIYGVVQAGPDTAPASGVNGQDQQVWSHMNIQTSYPWISYNGGFNRLSQWQMSGAYGPFILVVGGGNESNADSWDIQVPEEEQASSGTSWIIKGTNHHLHNTQIVSIAARSYIDAIGLVCDGCSARASQPTTTSGLTVNGNGNKIDIRSSAAGMLGPGVVVDNGVNNVVTISLLESPGVGGQPSKVSVVNLARSQQFAGSRTPDFAIGNPTTPFYNLGDLLFFAKDYELNPAMPVVADANSFSGYYAAVTAFLNTRGFTSLKGDPLQAIGSGSAVISNAPAGRQVPASVVTIYESAKCPVQTSYTFNVQASVSSGTTIASATFPCTTTYTTNSIVVDLSAQNGKNFGFGWAGVTNEVDSAWVAVVPYSVSSTAGKNTSPKTSATSTMLDPSWVRYTATSGSIGGSALTAGQCASGTTAIAGSTTTMTVNVSPNTYPGDGMIPWGYVSANGTVTVKVCAELAGTPVAGTYNVRVLP